MRRRRVLRAIVGCALVVGGAGQPARATAPSNDTMTSATQLCCFPDNAPDAQHATTTQATTQTGERLSPCGGTIGHTVWYKLSLRGGGPWPVGVSTAGSNYDVTIAVYTTTKVNATAFSDLTPLSPVSCSAGASAANGIAFAADLNAYTYYFQVGGKGVANGSLAFTYETNVV